MGAEAFIEGLQGAGPNPTRAAFIANLRQVHNYTAGGLEPPLDFATVQSVVPTCDYLISIHGGKFVPVATTPFCAPLIKLS
jgi:branched-chain amino acid transport system substrate-binding protein